ncbi:hypothetical protein [uncultured Roseovarius sp.]|uniref:hypothetical protein n=1 Tax=uncultured Roseovarius sp. TaxID=293344 RepID=UPI00262658A8|nr:hypothetical protein [uncultured Roseovarius sp.]
MSVLAGCGGGFRQSRANPRNWFGRSRSRRRVPQTPADNSNPLIPEREDSIFRRNREKVYEGTLVDQVVETVVERTNDGGIIRVSGQTLRQGAYDVRLVSDTGGEPVNGTLEYKLMAIQPVDEPQGAARARTVQAAVFVSSQTLDRADVVRVVGARNAQVSRR